ncbi:MAG: type II toxin-antitoxin system HipA family toxin [Gammaproteobacteria bacterium]|nr:type II toxin-antitoxin system HipA family toxin [Gammaproteobacteria bacterium]
MMKIEGRIKQLDVHTPRGFSGQLFKNAHFAFNYGSEATIENQVSITMGLRNESYTRGALFPVFEMNLPEGYVRHYVTERLRKVATIDDMLFLALSGNNGIGRLSYKTKLVDMEASQAISLESIIASGNSTALFAELVETYLLHTSVGVSGIQPKVVVPEKRGTLALPSLIVKSGNAEYPNIAVNEFVCLSIAKEAGLRTPEFWNTEDRQLFIMRRFDILESGEKLGMEDFSVLMGKSGDKKYEGRYETLLRAANLYEVDVTEMFEQIALSLIIGNGDAHLKNFAILYENVDGPFQLSPVYDVVCTRPYGDETTALSINKSRNYPSRTYLQKMGKQFGVREPDKIIDRIGDAVGVVCGQYSEILAQLGALEVHTSIIKNRDLVMKR